MFEMIDSDAFIVNGQVPGDEATYVTVAFGASIGNIVYVTATSHAEPWLFQFLRARLHEAHVVFSVMTGGL